MVSKKLLSVSLNYTSNMIVITLFVFALLLNDKSLLPLSALVLAGTITAPMLLAGLCTYVFTALLTDLFSYGIKILAVPAMAVFVLLFTIFSLIYRQIVYIPILG